MTTVIAERELLVSHDSGSATGFVRIFAPEDAGDCWWCAVHISWPGFEQKTRLAGVDSYQALLLALKIVPTLISISDDFKAGRLHEFDSDIALSDLEFSFGFGPYEGTPS